MHTAPGVNLEEKVRAISSWTAQNDWQLSFEVGELIIVLDKFEGKSEYEGWNQGKLGDEVGLFPVSYTEPHKPKEYLVNEKKISQLVANLQKQCGFLKSEGIADLKKEFNDLQKELANSPSKPKSNNNSIGTSGPTPTAPAPGSGGGVASAAHHDVSSLLVQIEDLRKELEQLRKKYKTESLTWNNDKKTLEQELKSTRPTVERLEQELRSARSEVAQLTEQAKGLSDQMRKRDYDIQRITEAREVQIEHFNKAEQARKTLEEKINIMKEEKRVLQMENRLKNALESSSKDGNIEEVLRKTIEEMEEKHRDEMASLKTEIRNLQIQNDSIREQLAQKAIEDSQSVQNETEEIESLKKQLSDRTKELSIAKHIIEQTAKITLKQQQPLSQEETQSSDQTLEALKEELSYSKQSVATIYAMLEDERKTHQMLIDDITLKNRGGQTKPSKWSLHKKAPSSGVVGALPKITTKAPSAPQHAIKIAELQGQIEECSDMIDALVEDKRQLVQMNTQLLGQIRSFLSNPPATFLEFHLKDQVEKNKTLVQELQAAKSQNETIHKKLTEQQKRIKELEKCVKPKSKDVPKQEETDPNYEEHVIDSQTNVLLQQLKELQSSAAALGVTPKVKTEIKVITSEAKLTQQLELIKQKLSDSRSRELDLELELIAAREELQKFKLAMEINNMIT